MVLPFPGDEMLPSANTRDVEPLKDGDLDFVGKLGAELGDRVVVDYATGLGLDLWALQLLEWVASKLALSDRSIPPALQDALNLPGRTRRLSS